MKYYSSKTIFYIIFVALFFTACENDNADNDKDKMLVPQENIKVRIPKFDGNAAKEFIAKQVSFGPRVPNSEGHKKCKDWLVSQFKSFGAEVIEQDFNATTYNNVKLNATNIIARYNPNVQERIILGAHWDTRPFAEKDPDPLRQSDPILGADDAGSGVGVLLEIAKLLQKNPIPMGVDIVLFDAEDYGDDGGDNAESWGLGSQYWGKNPHLKRENVKYGILLDMVGAKDAKFYKEGYSISNAGPLTNKIWKLAESMKKDDFFIDEPGGIITDDHYFVMKNFRMPMTDIISMPAENFGFGSYHHTHADNMEVIDVKTLEAVGQVITAVIYKQSNKEFLKENEY
jgi:Zn-dependent M28 family amino/carboxypeptidase